MRMMSSVLDLTFLLYSFCREIRARSLRSASNNEPGQAGKFQVSKTRTIWPVDERGS